jgi:fatty-acyl-CoA synthase
MITEERATVASGVPTIWMGLYQELKAHPRDISSLRLMIVGGSAMPRSLTKAYESEFGVEVLHAWGMTEMSPLGTVCNLLSQHTGLSDERKWDVKATQGYPVFGVEIRIVDEEGNELPWDGETMGELQVRGPWIISQYFKREVTEDYMSRDGWFRTGDVVTIRPEGYIHIRDRTKDLIKSGGEWISTVDLEGAIMAHPKVMEAAVIAIPDEKWMERPLAVVVPAPSTEQLDEAEIKGFLQDKIARFWLPDKIIFLPEIPKTSVGKFDKKVLRARYAEGELA